MDGWASVAATVVVRLDVVTGAGRHEAHALIAAVAPSHAEAGDVATSSGTGGRLVVG